MAGPETPSLRRPFGRRGARRKFHRTEIPGLRRAYPDLPLLERAKRIVADERGSVKLNTVVELLRRHTWAWIP